MLLTTKLLFKDTGHASLKRAFFPQENPFYKLANIPSSSLHSLLIGLHSSFFQPLDRQYIHLSGFKTPLCIIDDHQRNSW